MLAMHLKEFRARNSLISRGMTSSSARWIGRSACPVSREPGVALLRKMFNLAKDWGLMSGDNPATRIQFFREVSRDRFLHPDELPRIFAAIAEEPDICIRAAFLMALLTGARREEVLTMRWEDINFERGMANSPDESESSPCASCSQTLALIAPYCNLPREGGNPYVFSGPRMGRASDEPEAGVAANSDQSTITDVRFHDLRRTIGSWLASSGESLNLLGRC